MHLETQALIKPSDSATLPYRLHPAVLHGSAPAVAPAFIAQLHDAPPPGAAAIFRTAAAQDDLPGILALAQKWQRFPHLVVVGSGGSGLSGLAVAMLQQGRRPMLAERRIHVLDNLDLTSQQHFISTLPPEGTAFLFISKSGSTVETMAHAYLIRQHLQQAGVADLPERIAIIAGPHESPLRMFAEETGCPTFIQDMDLGGRFSMLSAIGLLPAAFLGLPCEELRAGAAEALSANLKGNAPAALGAAQQAQAMQAGKNISIFMPYSEKLWGLALWWRQSWAESLGKEGKGSTPSIAIGTTDQHSQLQLYLDGPDDKLYTLLFEQPKGKGPRLPEAKGKLDYLSGHALGDLIAAQQYATLESLRAHRRPVRMLEVAEATPRTFGALYMHFVLEIIYIAHLLGIDPFTQPAVEESKRLAHQNLLEG